MKIAARALLVLMILALAGATRAQPPPRWLLVWWSPGDSTIDGGDDTRLGTVWLASPWGPASVFG